MAVRASNCKVIIVIFGRNHISDRGYYVTTYGCEIMIMTHHLSLR